MSPSDALYRAVCAAPHDDLPRLVYADWLEENGRSERAEFIRVQCRLANASPADADYVDLLEREAELKAILWRELDADRPALPSGIGWEPEHRGFAERLRFGQTLPPDAAAQLEGCSAGVPIGGLRFERLGNSGVRPFATVIGHTVTSLDLPDLRTLDGPVSAPGVFPALRRLSFAGQFHHLDLRHLSINAGLRELCLPEYATTPPAWEGLTADLRVFQFRLGLGRVTAPLPEVHTLRVGRFVREDGGVFNSLPKLASLTTWSGDWPALLDRRQRPLAELRAYFPKVPRKLEDFFRQEWVEGVRVLEPQGGPEQVQSTLLSPRLTGLRQLRLRPGNYPWLTARLDDVVWWPSLTTFDAGHQRLVFSKRDWLARGLRAPNLKYLNLTSNPLGDDGAMALANNPSLSNLTRLNLSACRIGPRGVEALLNSPHLQRLIELNLYANNGAEALAPLADTGVMPNLGLADVAANGVSDELRSRLEQRPAIRAR